MTHMFVANLTDDGNTQIETYKFVLKNGLLGVLEDTNMPTNVNPGLLHDDEAKVNIMCAAVANLPQDLSPKQDKNAVHIAYCEDETYHIYSDALDNGWDDRFNMEQVVTTSLEDFKEKYDYFAEMLPKSCLGDPTMVGFFKQYADEGDDDARYRTVKKLHSERYGEDISKPAPYRKPKTFERDNDIVLHSTGLFAIHQSCDNQNTPKYRLGYFDFKLTVGGQVGLTPSNIYVYKGEHAMLSLLRELLTNHQHQHPSVIMADSRMEKQYGVTNYYANYPSPMFEAPWFRIPWAPRECYVEQVSSGNPYEDGPLEDLHVQLPGAEYFQAMLPSKWQDDGLLAIGFIHPSNIHPSEDDFTAWQVSEHAEKGLAPFVTTEEILSKIEKQFELAPGELTDDPQPISRTATVDETSITTQQDPRDLWDGKVHILDPKTGRYEELKIMTDEQFRNMTFDTQQPDPQTNPEYYQGFTGAVELIDITENLSFNGGNAVKYLARATRVDGNNKHENPITDLRKAKWYVEREIERLEGENQ